jgi:hypothetical protein
MTATTTDPARRYGLVTPCKKCPFRTDVEPYLRTERAQEIADSLHAGTEFPCHETTVRKVDDEGNDTLADGPRSRFCAGAMATMEREGNPNQMLRVAERLGFYDPAKLAAREQPVYRSLSDWVQAHVRANEGIPTFVDEDGHLHEYEHCGVVADECEDPAGYMSGGAAMESADPPTCHPWEDECEGCNRAVCAGCRSEQWDKDGGQFCVYCYNPDADEDEGTEGTEGTGDVE